MIVFNDLRITKDKSALLIKVSVSTLHYFKDTKIKHIYVLNEAMLEELELSVDDIQETNIESRLANYKVWDIEDYSDSDGKTAECVVSAGTFLNGLLDENNHPYKYGNLDKHVWFVFVHTNGIKEMDTPCTCTDPVVGVTMYMGDIYNNFMSYIKELNRNNCQIPQGMIDQFLRFKAMNIAFDAGHYTAGIDYFKRWFTGDYVHTSVSSNCGCHG